jgi:glyoxylase-like metal-dependent hydrolase (beta-lactamase superfamily II)
LSNSYSERNRATALQAFETLFNNGCDYAGGRRPVTELKPAQHTRASRSGWPAVRFAAALLVMLASFVAGPNPVLAAAAQHHDQVPGFYRLKVGDLEVTALLDGPAVLDLNWLTGEKATLDGVVKAWHEDPHMLDAADTGFLVNTGKQLILVDAGSGTWFGGGAYGRLVGNLRSAGYTPEEVDLVLVTHLHSDHVGGLTTRDGNRVFPNAEIYVAKVESDFWLSPEIAAKAPKDAQQFFQSAQAIAAPYIKAGKWHTFSDSDSDPIVDGMQLVPLHGHTPGHTGYVFSSQGKQILFWGDTIHGQRVQLQHPEVTVVFDIDPAAALATRKQLLSKLAHEDVVIAGPHMLFPGLCTRKGVAIAGRQWHLPINGRTNSNAAGRADRSSRDHRN